jgi:MarR family 2-MHQ and catechol resistance regulon transcriptional repressor
MTTRLQREIKQTKPFGSPGEEALLNVMRTAAMLEHKLAEALKPHGVTPTQYNVLRILRGAGSDGLCRNEIRDRMIKAVPDATRLLDRLEQAGLAKRYRGDSDRRFVTARITERGLELLDRLDDPLNEMFEARLGHLSRSDLRALSELLGRARERC